MSIEDCIKYTNDGVIINFKISPNSSKNQIILSEETIKIKVTAQPIENKANKAVIQFLSKLVKVPKTSIEILRGNTSKDKTILIRTTSEEKKNEIKTIILNDDNDK